jgi:hypothetical protein
MPDEQDEELWVDPTQQSLAPNTTCPVSGKDLLSLKDPVKCVTAMPQYCRICSVVIRMHAHPQGPEWLCV